MTHKVLGWPWRIAGQRLFGHWLPFIGFRSLWVDIFTMEPVRDGNGEVKWADEWDYHEAYQNGEIALARVFSIAWLALSINLGVVMNHE